MWRAPAKVGRVGLVTLLCGLLTSACSDADSHESAAAGSGGSSAGSGGAGSGASGPGGSTPGVTFPLTISSDNEVLVDQAGQPFLIRGDTAWSLIAELSKTEALAYLDDRAARGFNCILTNLIEPAFSSHDPPWRNAEGETPFDDIGDFTSMREAYFAHADWVLAEAEKRGMLVLLVPSYIGYGCGAEGWCETMRQNGVERLTAYGELVGARYRDVGNILWVNAGDHTPDTSGDPSDMDLVNAVAAGLEAGDGGVHYHTAHWANETSGGEVEGATWLDVDSTYSYTAPSLYVKTLADHQRDAGVRPFFLFEALYENEHQTTMLSLRAQMYQPMLSGAAGFVFGNYPMWSFWDPGDPGWFLDDGGFPGGWSTALDSPGSQSASIAGDLLASLAWYDLEPDVDDLVVVGGQGDFGSSDYALAARTPGGELVLVYLSAALTPTIDLSQLAGPVSARWFDPASGAETVVDGSPFDNAGEQLFTTPGDNTDGSADWLLILQAE
jgi:hypothetical protein